MNQLGPGAVSLDPALPSSAPYPAQHFAYIPNVIAQLVTFGLSFSEISKENEKSVSQEVVFEILMGQMGFKIPCDMTYFSFLVYDKATLSFMSTFISLDSISLPL